MMKNLKNILLLFLFLSVGVLSVTECEAVLIFHKPAYQGKIIDMETKEPLEGVVVVAVYQIESIFGYPGGGWGKDIHAQEVLTDKDGFFRIPPCTRLVGLNSKAAETQFIIYKPGYASYPEQRIKIIPFQHCGPSWLFIGKTGATTEINKKIYKNGILTVLPEKITITFGIVELPKLNTWEERDKAHSVPGTGDFNPPILYQMVQKEHEWLKQNQGWRRQ
ncbi:MAG: hypothetical protein AB1724_12135 [Thermodesulfobacteriota bacterium]